MPTLRQEPGKLIERTWSTRGPGGRKVRHTALGYDLTVNRRRERKFSSAWLTDKALERAGIPKGTDPTSRVSFHTLRHTAASWLTIRGASLRTVQDVLGHATPA